MIIAISQRRNHYNGGTDALEASYVKYFSRFGATLVPIPNNVNLVANYFKNLDIKGIILSGGGDIDPSLYRNPMIDGNYSKEREETESVLLRIGMELDLPILGICRGMEFINVSFGGKLTAKISNGTNHDNIRHKVILWNNEVIEVNSYHRLGINNKELSSKLKSFATATDKSIEGIYHPSKAIAGIIWHPEREKLDLEFNKSLIKAFLSRDMFWKKGMDTKNE